MNNLSSNVTNSDGLDIWEFHSYEWTWLYTCYWVFKWLWTVLGTTGNILTLMAIWKFEGLQTIANYNIVSLAIADLVSGIVQACFTLAANVNTKRTQSWLICCVFGRLFTYIGGGGNIMSICWIAVDRFVFIHKPLHYYTLITKKRVALWLGISWTYLVLMCVTVIILSSPEMYRIGVCELYLYKTYCLMDCIIQPYFWVISTVTLILYIQISYTAYKHGQRIQNSGIANNPVRKITKMMASVIGIYFVLYLPIILVSLVGILEYNASMTERLIIYIADIIFMVNMWINPVIYYFNNENFHKAFRKILHLN